jgi:hypothetical protein
MLSRQSGYDEAISPFIGWGPYDSLEPFLLEVTRCWERYWE